MPAFSLGVILFDSVSISLEQISVEPTTYLFYLISVGPICFCTAISFYLPNLLNIKNI